MNDGALQSFDLTSIERFFLSVLMTSPRLMAIFGVVPFLSGEALTGFTRSGFLMMLAIFFSPIAADSLPIMSITTWLLIATKEVLIGLMLGMALSLFFWAIQSVGDLIDFQTGSANASFFDPISGHAGGPTSSFLTQLAVTLFMSTGGMLVMLGIVVESYRIWPVNSFLPNIGIALERFVIQQGDSLFYLIVKLATPVILVLLLVELGIGLVSRFVPQLNVFIFALPLKSLLATLMMILFLTFVFDSLQGFLQPGNNVLGFLRALL